MHSFNSKKLVDLSEKTKFRFSISLGNLFKPISVGETARTWDTCARAVFLEYAQVIGAEWLKVFRPLNSGAIFFFHIGSFSSRDFLLLENVAGISAGVLTFLSLRFGYNVFFCVKNRDFMTMKNVDLIRTIANRYAFQLQLCDARNPLSFSIARTVHAHMICYGFKPHGHILNRLIDIYCKSSKLINARRLFDEIPQQDVVSRTTLITAYSASGNLNMCREIFSKTPLNLRDTVFYNAMITAYSHNNDGLAAIELFRDMMRDDFRPDNFTFTSVLSALGLIADEEYGCMQMHSAVVKSGAGLFTSVLNALVSVYVKCASSPFVSSVSLMSMARKVYDEMPERDELSWTTMITGYVKNGDLDAAREFLDRMSKKVGVAWNAMMSGYVHQEYYKEALEIFRKMLSLGIQLDEFTYTSVISACSNAGLLRFGKEVHAYFLKMEAKPTQEFSLPVNNALVTLYWKCGKVDKARDIFNQMPVKDLVSWNGILSAYVSVGRIDEAKSFFGEMKEKNILTWTVMISGLAQNGLGEDGLKLFSQMRLEGCEPCDYAFAGAITSSAVLGALENGRQLHAQLVRFGYESSLSAGNALITMYARMLLHVPPIQVRSHVIKMLITLKRVGPAALGTPGYPVYLGRSLDGVSLAPLENDDLKPAVTAEPR
ncbi:hypothetical protein Patl1_21080 [Pistacia atlantica]|uniref:Uncharacterized protein n=1 Tax=Pistacia atlantica TaxID=434234 RepID=A0ACC1BJ97_9ROSI|nr:hypothetical protein Patl1_21080 [Pistacia atlantica]